MASSDSGSTLLLDEFFDREDPRFVEQLRDVGNPGTLANFVERWKKDPRPWARREKVRYLELPFDCPGHQPVVKRLFKDAERQRDDELMALFCVAFDRLVRRERRRQWRWDTRTRSSYQEEVLATPRNTLPRGATPRRHQRVESRRKSSAPGRLFSYRTRYYLRRRVWRYFRHMAHQRPEVYPTAIAAALVRYRDDDFDTGEHLLDNWSLVHACYGAHEALAFGTSKIKLRAGRRLSELNAAPAFPELWQKPESFPVLLQVVERANARLVRVWGMELLRRDHAERLNTLPVDHLLRLLDHDDAEVQQFAADRLESSTWLETLPVATWLRLLETRNLTALETICQLATRSLAADRLSLAECIELTCAEPAPVARLGLAFVRTKTRAGDDDRRLIARLARVRCAAVGGEAAWLGLNIVGAPDEYNRDLVLEFFDSLLPEIREAAWNWLMGGSPGFSDPVLWSRLLETPFDDLRLRIVDHLESRSTAPRPQDDALVPVWSSVLANVNRGGRQKRKAVHQVAAAVGRNTEQADTLLPVLAVSLRSVRAPERREALAAIATLVESHPELSDQLARELPELNLSPQDPRRWT